MDDQQQPETRVKFGPRPTQTIPIEYAEAILTDLAARQPVVFGNYLKRAVLADLPQNGQRRQ